MANFAINFVAQQYGYQVVEIQHELDVFLIRKDILQDTCSNYDELPTFEILAKDTLDKNTHMRCNLAKEGQRLVHVPLHLEGKHAEAKKKAQEVIQEMNRRRTARGDPAYCL